MLPSDPGVIAELAWGAEPTASLTITQQLVGTPLYLSPEALAGQAAQPSFDLWGLTLVLYEAYAGRHPLAGESVVDLVKTIQRGVLPDIRDFRPECPSSFAAFLSGPIGKAAQALVGELPHEPELAAAFRETFLISQRDVLRGILDRAAERGELRADAPRGMAVEIAGAALIYRLMLTGDPLDEPFVEKVVEQVLLPLVHA